MRIDTVDASLAPGLAHQDGTTTISIVQVEAQDSLDLLLSGIQGQSGPVILLVPEEGRAFGHSGDFERLRTLQQTGLAPEYITFVLPPTRANALGRFAYQQGFPWSSSLERAIASLYQPPQADAYVAPNTAQQEMPTTFPQAPVIAELLSVSPAEGEYGSGGTEGTCSAPDLVGRARPPYTTGPLQGAGQHPPPQRRLSRKRLALIALVLVVGGCIWLLPNLLTGSSMLSPAPPSVVGQLVFTNSGQLDPTSAQGINDVVIADLRGIAPPASGNALYAWLRPDSGQDEVKPILLGQLAVTAGHARLTYGSPTHDDLLATFSRFLVTEQPARPVPVTPPLDTAVYRFQASVAAIPNPADEQHHFTALDHLRHLLARDPTVRAIGLAGGLNIWLYRNSLEVEEEATTARDYWQYRSSTPYMHRQVVRILDYLDGYNYALRDVPLIDPITQAESGFLIDRKYGELGLLTLDQQQQPPGYLAHVSVHLDGLANSPGATPAQVALAKRLDTVISEQITPLFKRVHDDAAQLVRMDGAHLQTRHALDLLNDMATYANAAVSGPIDPLTGNVGKGTAWLHAQMSRLAVIEVTRYTAPS
jgi:hypothetical protein